jgi:hypothetical protein
VRDTEGFDFVGRHFRRLTGRLESALPSCRAASILNR